MRLYSLGEIEWKDTQLLYHSMAYLGIEGVIVCRPASPYFCVGFHQGVDQELDVASLRSIGEPYFRRETGGGTVRLDRGQVFYQIIIRRDSPYCPPNPERFYERYLQPAISALERLGLGAIIAYPNDIQVNRRKISGNGGGEVGECKVLVGDILVNFEPELMVRGLNCPTEQFRQACLRSMNDNMTSVRQQSPSITVEEVERALRMAYLKVCGDGEATRLPEEVLSKAQELEAKMLSDSWLHFPGPNRPGRRVKVREGVHVATLPLTQAKTGKILGHILLKTCDGALDKIDFAPAYPKDDVQECISVAKMFLKERGGRFIKDIERLIQDMDIEKESLDGVMSDFKGRISRL